jgi:hypothetical protein
VKFSTLLFKEKPASFSPKILIKFSKALPCFLIEFFGIHISTTELRFFIESNTESKNKISFLYVHNVCFWNCIALSNKIINHMKMKRVLKGFFFKLPSLVLWKYNNEKYHAKSGSMVGNQESTWVLSFVKFYKIVNFFFSFSVYCGYHISMKNCIDNRRVSRTKWSENGLTATLFRLDDVFVWKVWTTFLFCAFRNGRQSTNQWYVGERFEHW